jgi:hypothetical protein
MINLIFFKEKYIFKKHIKIKVTLLSKPLAIKNNLEIFRNNRNRWHLGHLMCKN